MIDPAVVFDKKKLRFLRSANLCNDWSTPNT